MKSIYSLVRFAEHESRCNFFLRRISENLLTFSLVELLLDSDSGLSSPPTKEPTDLLEPMRCSYYGVTVTIGVCLFLPINFDIAFFAL